MCDISLVEKEIINMFKDISRVEVLNKECRDLEHQSEDIRKDIKETNVGIDAYMNFGIDYSSLSVQVSKNGDSHMEKDTLNAISKLEQEWKNIRKMLLDKKKEIRELNREISLIKRNIDELKDEHKNFIYMLYEEGRTMLDIASEFHIAERTAHRRKKKILQYISKWDYFKEK